MGKVGSKNENSTKNRYIFRCDLTNLSSEDTTVITYGNADYQVNASAEVELAVVTLGGGVTKTISPQTERLELIGGEMHEIQSGSTYLLSNWISFWLLSSGPTVKMII